MDVITGLTLDEKLKQSGSTQTQTTVAVDFNPTYSKI
jgi:hypothetical protein